LTAAHDKGFVHRDLKPDNVFLVHRAGDWPEVKLLDFGLAKLMPEAGISPFTTKTGVMLGTPEYMSPEQARGTGVDYRTDIYALGILTFELLARQRPFPSLGDPFATMQAHIEELPPSLRDLVAGLPDELVQLVEAMLAKDPAARPSLAAVRNVIKRLRSTALSSRTEASLDAAPIPPPAVLPRTSGLAPDDAAATVANMRRVSTPPTAEVLPPTSPMRKGPSSPPSTQPSQPSHPSVPSYQSMHVGSALSVPGRDSLARTRLGVAPAKAPTSPPSFGQLTAPTPAPVSKSSHLWLLLGAMLAIAAGIAIAIAFVAVG
jgi:serine/threonine-protein kinase